MAQSNNASMPFTTLEQLSFTDEQLFEMYETCVELEKIDQEVKTSDLSEARSWLELISRM